MEGDLVPLEEFVIARARDDFLAAESVKAKVPPHTAASFELLATELETDISAALDTPGSDPSAVKSKLENLKDLVGTYKQNRCVNIDAVNLHSFRFELLEASHDASKLKHVCSTLGLAEDNDDRLSDGKEEPKSSTPPSSEQPKEPETPSIWITRELVPTDCQILEAYYKHEGLVRLPASLLGRIDFAMVCDGSNAFEFFCQQLEVDKNKPNAEKLKDKNVYRAQNVIKAVRFLIRHSAFENCAATNPTLLGALGMAARLGVPFVSEIIEELTLNQLQALKMKVPQTVLTDAFFFASMFCRKFPKLIEKFLVVSAKTTGVLRRGSAPSADLGKRTMSINVLEVALKFVEEWEKDVTITKSSGGEEVDEKQMCSVLITVRMWIMLSILKVKSLIGQEDPDTFLKLLASPFVSTNSRRLQNDQADAKAEYVYTKIRNALPQFVLAMLDDRLLWIEAVDGFNFQSIKNINSGWLGFHCAPMLLSAHSVTRDRFEATVVEMALRTRLQNAEDHVDPSRPKYQRDRELILNEMRRTAWLKNIARTGVVGTYTKLVDGREVETDEPNTVAELSLQVKLNITDCTASNFSPGELPEVQLLIKNVPRLVVKVFEIDCENYYVNNRLQPFSFDVNLEGVAATWEKSVLQYTNPPLQEHEEIILFPELKGRRGLYVVEFIGAGLRSRFVLQTATLSLLHEPCAIGTVCYMLDSDNETVLKGPGVRMYVNGKWLFPVDAERGQFIVPSCSKTTVLLMDGGIGTLAILPYQPTASYQVKCQFSMVEESLVPGHRAHLLAFPSLRYGNKEEKCFRQVLSKAEVKLTINTLGSNKELVPMVRTFFPWEENLEDSGKDDNIVCSFSVPSKLVSISAVFSAEVHDYQKKETVKICSSTFQKSFDATFGPSLPFFLHLARGTNELEVFALGMDGEPCSGVVCQVSLSESQGMSYFLTEKARSKKMVTDSEGRITICGTDRQNSTAGNSFAPLEWFSELCVKAEWGSDELARTWKLESTIWVNSSRLAMTRTPSMTLIEKQELRLPIPMWVPAWATAVGNDISDAVLPFTLSHRLSKVRGSRAALWSTSSLGECMGVTISLDHSQSELVVTGLAAGHYNLSMQTCTFNFHTVSIEVLQGKPWNADSKFFVDIGDRDNSTGNRICKLNNESSDYRASISSLRADREQGVTVQLSSDFDPATSRVHVFAARFVPGSLLREFIDLPALTNNVGNSVFSSAKTFKNVKQSNLKLGDELRYILSRQSGSSQVGNLLARPQLLLNPRVSRETTWDNEVLQETEAFMADQISMQSSPVCTLKCASDCDGGGKGGGGLLSDCDRGGGKGGKSCGGGKGGGTKGCGSKGGGDNRLGVAPENQIKFSAFLKKEVVSLFNLHVDSATNRVVVPAHSCGDGLSEARLVVAIAVDNATNRCAYRIEHVRGGDNCFESRGLSLRTPLSPEKAFVERKIAVSLQAKGVYKFNDYTSCEWRNIDSISRLLTFYSVLKQSWASILVDEWKIDRWGNLEQAEKNKIWSANCCHEINLFIYCYDALFFETSIKPFLRCKGDKTIIDHFLLGNMDELRPYIQMPHLFENLNLLEQTLLIRLFSFSKPLDIGDSCSNPSPLALASAMADRANAKTRRNGNYRKLRNTLLDACLHLESSKGSDSPGDEHSLCRSLPKREGKGGGKGCNKKKRSLGMEMYSAVVERMEDDKDWEPPAKTNEYVETQHYVDDARGIGHGTQKYNANLFWAYIALKYAQGTADGLDSYPSESFLFATSSFHELAAAVALIGLPLQAKEHLMENHSSTQASLTAGSPCVIVSRETVEVPRPLRTNTEIVLVTRTYRPLVETREEAKPITESFPFMVREPYVLHVTLASLSWKPLEVDVLVQIPEGAVPLGAEGGQFLNVTQLRLKQSFVYREMIFYFPRAGTFQGASVAISRKTDVLVRSSPVSVEVVGNEEALRTKLIQLQGTGIRTSADDTAKIDSLIAKGIQTFKELLRAAGVGANGIGHEDILTFLRERDLIGGELKFSFGDLLFYFKSDGDSRRQLWTESIKVLRDRGIFNKPLWELSLSRFLDRNIAAEVLAANESAMSLAGRGFSCSLLQGARKRCVETMFGNDAWIHKDYFPLFNKRAHKSADCQTSGANKILNRELRSTYTDFIRELARTLGNGKCSLALHDRLRLVYYLICLERFSEATQVFEVFLRQPSASNFELQADYIAAFLNLSTAKSDLIAARRVVAKYFPEGGVCTISHQKWAQKFETVKALVGDVDVLNSMKKGREAEQEFEAVLVDLIDGGNVDFPEATGVAGRGKAEPMLQVTPSPINSNQLEIQGHAVTEVKIKLYKINLEILFSTKPFSFCETHYSSEIYNVRPVHESTVKMDQAMSVPFSATDWKIPDELQKADLAVEVCAAAEGLTASTMRFASRIQLYVAQRHGHFTVVSEGEVVAGAYCKVYVASTPCNGSHNAKFFKDGYTDIRGRFDYASLSGGDEVDAGAEFAVMVMTQNGGIVKKVSPPRLHIGRQ